jgi:protein-tyrosine phosphatase
MPKAGVWARESDIAQRGTTGAEALEDLSLFPLPRSLLIDTHSHLLPGVDDGSRSVKQSAKVLEAFGGSGITDVVLTPHTSVSVLAEHLDDEIEHRDEVFVALRKHAPEVPRLHLGFEIMLDEVPPPGLLTDRRLALGGSRYVLVEVRIGERPAQIAESLGAAVDTDLVLIVAHPERYWRCSVADIAGWKALGAKLQLDATALTRNNPRGHRSRELLRAGLADLVAADNHGGTRSVATAVAYLEEHGQPEVARLLAVENPRAVIEDRKMEEVGPVGVGTRLGDIVRSFIPKMK